jgi:putative hydrolase of HD superfamily
MNSGALNAQIGFLREIEKLKTVTRANRTLDGRSENSAEHCWQVALPATVKPEGFMSRIG